MKIISVRAQVLSAPEHVFRFSERSRGGRLQMLLLRVAGEDGTEGHCITWLASPGHLDDWLPRLRMTMVGRDIHDVEAISNELTDKLNSPGPFTSAADIALWDLIGKHHGQPVYKLLGAARHSLRAYATTLYYETIEEYIEIAFQCRDEGFNALKLHPFGEAKRDIELCRAVREAVGDSMDLMLDPLNSYHLRDAVRVGRVMEKLGFLWYEAPLPDTDVDGLRYLTQTLDVPISGAESVAGGLLTHARYVADRTVNSIRPVGDFIGGITALRKTAALCEAFNVGFEPHSYGSTLVQAAHFNVMLATTTCEFMELPAPTGLLDQGMKNTLRVGADGLVQAPTLPGLGYEIDDDAIEALIERELQGSPFGPGPSGH